jgi:hypothetical protein
MEYRNNHSKRRWLKLFSICVGIVAIGTIGFLVYLISQSTEISKTQPIPTVSTPPTTPSPTPSSPPNEGQLIVPQSSTAVTTVTPPPQAILSLNYNFGISFGDTLPGLSSQALNKELDDLVSLHIGWIRFDMAWDDVQPNNSSSFNWTSLDRVVAAANARHIKLLPDLGYTPSWATVSGCSTKGICAPANPAQFATFVKAAVARYAPEGISDWEIWNEPNNTGFWQPKPNAEAYAMLLEDSYLAIKSIEPSSTVISAGLAPEITTDGNIAPLDFLAQLYADGAGPYFDAVGFHPYSYPALPSDYQDWNAWSQMASTTPSLRSIMTANGDANKKIWLTEYGAPTNGPGMVATSGTLSNWPGNPDHVTEALQSEMFTDAITSVEQLPWAGPLFFYSYKDLGTSTSTDQNFFGIIRYDGSTKPAYTTMKDLLSSP